MDSQQVTDIFVERGYLTPEQAEAFIQAAQQSSDSKGIPVSIQSVMEKATEQAIKKIQPMIR